MLSFSSIAIVAASIISPVQAIGSGNLRGSRRRSDETNGLAKLTTDNQLGETFPTVEEYTEKTVAPMSVVSSPFVPTMRQTERDDITFPAMPQMVSPDLSAPSFVAPMSVGSSPFVPPVGSSPFVPQAFGQEERKETSTSVGSWPFGPTVESSPFVPQAFRQEELNGTPTSVGSLPFVPTVESLPFGPQAFGQEEFKGTSTLVGSSPFLANFKVSAKMVSPKSSSFSSGIANLDSQNAFNGTSVGSRSFGEEVKGTANTHLQNAFEARVVGSRPFGVEVNDIVNRVPMKKHNKDKENGNDKLPAARVGKPSSFVPIDDSLKDITSLASNVRNQDSQLGWGSIFLNPQPKLEKAAPNKETAHGQMVKPKIIRFDKGVSIDKTQYPVSEYFTGNDDSLFHGRLVIQFAPDGVFVHGLWPRSDLPQDPGSDFKMETLGDDNSADFDKEHISLDGQGMKESALKVAWKSVTCLFGPRKDQAKNAAAVKHQWTHHGIAAWRAGQTPTEYFGQVCDLGSKVIDMARRYYARSMPNVKLDFKSAESYFHEFGPASNGKNGKKEILFPVCLTSTTGVKGIAWSLMRRGAKDCSADNKLYLE